MIAHYHMIQSLSLFFTHLYQHLSGIVSVCDSCFVKSCIESKAHISHQLVYSVSGHFAQLHLVSLIVLHFFALHHCLSWSIQPLF